MRAQRQARPSAGRSHEELVASPQPVKHGHKWHTAQAGRQVACANHTARVADGAVRKIPLFPTEI